MKFSPHGPSHFSLGLLGMIASSKTQEEEISASGLSSLVSRKTPPGCLSSLSHVPVLDLRAHRFNYIGITQVIAFASLFLLDGGRGKQICKGLGVLTSIAL